MRRNDAAIMSSQQEPFAQFASFAILAALPESATPPEWVTLFPKLGDVLCVDGRKFSVDGDLLAANFASGGLDIAIDVNHATEIKGPKGEDAPAVGWIRELRVRDGALQGRTEWLASGAKLVADKAYRYLSAAFYHSDDLRALRLKSVGLTNSPAVIGQKALTHAQQWNRNMSELAKLAAALSVVATANEDAMVAALAANFVPKAEHDKALLAAKQIGDKATADLALANEKLAKIEADGRKTKVDGLIESALATKKILPAEKDHYVALCASDAGLDSVAKLFAAKGVALKESGLDKKKVEDDDVKGGVSVLAAAQKLAAQAKKAVETGEAPDYLSAVAMLSAKAAA